MKLYMCLAMVLLIISEMNADWTLRAVYVSNNLALRCVGAYRLKNGKKKSTYLDKKIKSAQKKSVVMVGFKVLKDIKSQGTTCIVMRDDLDPKAEYTLCFDCQSAASLASSRLKTQNLNNIPSDLDHSNLDYFYARIELKKNGTLLAQDYQKYPIDNESAEFDALIKQDLAGNITIRLEPPVDRILN